MVCDLVWDWNKKWTLEPSVLEKLLVPQVAKKFPIICATHMSSLYPPELLKIRFNIIFSYKTWEFNDRALQQLCLIACYFDFALGYFF